MKDEIAKVFIETYNIPQEDYVEVGGVIEFTKDHTLMKCNIFGMGWVLSKSSCYEGDKEFIKEMQNKALQSIQ